MEKILIVDDSPTQAAQLKSILDMDYDVTVAQTATEGLSHASSGKFTLVLLDVVMPGMDGFTLLKKLQEEIVTQSIPVILITSLSDIEHEQLGLTLGAVDYMNTHIKLYRYRKQIEYQSMTDQLTGIANRRQHDIFSIIKWNEATRLKVPFSICMFDIDYFKSYNDTFGHPAGDKVIATVAKVISSHLQRSTDFVARYGGEEFVAFFMGGMAEQAYEYLKKIRKSVEECHIPHDPATAKWVTISAGGVTMIPQKENSYEVYLKIADTMLYDAKRMGRNRVVWANEKMEQWYEE